MEFRCGEQVGQFIWWTWCSYKKSLTTLVVWSLELSLVFCCFMKYINKHKYMYAEIIHEYKSSLITKWGCLPVCQFVCMPIYSSVHPSACLPTCVSVLICYTVIAVYPCHGVHTSVWLYTHCTVRYQSLCLLSTAFLGYKYFKQYLRK